MVNTEMEAHLVKMWFDHKYWSSSCEDEALDWCQHPNHLSINELAEYIEWRTKYLKVIEDIRKLAQMNDEIYYSLRPWVAAKENKRVIVKEVTKK